MNIDIWLVNVICCWAAFLTVANCEPRNNNRRAIDRLISVTSSGNVSSQRQDAGAVLPVGEAFNLFQSYGLLAFNINVAPLVLLPARPHNGSMQPYQMPLFQMITHPVLDRRMYTPEIKRHQVNNPRSIFKSTWWFLHKRKISFNSAIIIWHSFQEGSKRSWNVRSDSIFVPMWRHWWLDSFTGSPSTDCRNLGGLLQLLGRNTFYPEFTVFQLITWPTTTSSFW